MKKNEERHLIDIFTEIFLYANNGGYNLTEFINLFFNSEIAKEIFECSDIVFFNPITIYNDFIRYNVISKDEALNKLPSVVVRYIAFIYIKYVFRTNENISSVLKQLPVQNVIDQFELIHTLDEENVIYESKVAFNLKMNPMRKVRMKESLSFDLSNDSKNLYIAKQLYLKLFNYPEIQTLRLGYFQNVECLQNETSMMYASTIDNSLQIQDILDIRVLEYIRFNKIKTILFLFDKANMITKEEMEEKFYNQKYNPYKELLIFSNKMIKYISNRTGYLEFYIPITSLDIRKIEEDYKKRFRINNK